MQDKKLAGKAALVTGSGRGMGREIALRLAQDGASLIIHYSGSATGAADTVREITAGGGTAIAYQANIANRAEVQSLFTAIDKTPGHIDIIVNCAGISGGGSLATLDDTQLEDMLGVNLRGPLYVASEAAKRLREGGRIINIGSTLSEFPLAGSGIYSATKAALKSFTQSWAKELGRQGVTVNCIIPGATSPGMMDKADAATRTFFENASPFGRIGHARDIAALTAFLASPEAAWISSAHILANGAANT